jgi:hypothetical protein
MSGADALVTDGAAKTTSADDAAMHAIAEAMREAARTVPEPAGKVGTSASDAGPRALETISRMVYTGSYVLAYGVVYAAVFVAQSLPQENPIMHGLRDGGKAAVDELVVP